MNGWHDGAIREQLLAPRAALLNGRQWLTVAAALVAAATLLLPATAAGAGSVYPTVPVGVSGLTLLPRAPEGGQGACGSWSGFQDWEQENWLAVNPANPDNLAVAWIQDDSDAIAVGYSRDGGKNWGRVVVPTTPCTGGLTGFGTGPGSSNDPSLSFGPDGAAYLTSNVSNVVGSDPAGVSATVVNVSHDGGEHWSAPQKLDVAATPAAIDNSNVIADPRRPGYAYAVWAKGVVAPAIRTDGRVCFANAAFNQYVSHTEDGGTTWSTPVPITSQPGRWEGAGHLLVLGDGSLLDVALSAVVNPTLCAPDVLGPVTLLARRSTDLGETWSAPTPIADPVDPKYPAFPSVALAPDGNTVYVAWQTRTPTPGSSTFSIMYAKSENGGVSWDAPAPVGAAPLFGLPEMNVHSTVLTGVSLAVADDGTVGVAFYDRRDAPGTAKAIDFWFRHSHDGGQTWQEDCIAGYRQDCVVGPTDRTLTPKRLPAPPFGGPGNPGFFGDYQGIAPLPGGLAITFALGQPLATTNAQPSTANTDLFFSRLRTALPDLQVTLSTANTKGVPEGKKVTLSATVSNRGDADAAASSTQFVLDGITVLGTVATDPIPAGGVRTVSVEWDTRGVKGEHMLTAIADGAAAVGESDENNNTDSLQVTVRGNQIRNGSFEQSENGTSPDSWSSSGQSGYESGGNDGLRSVSTGVGGSWSSEPVPIAAGGSYDVSVVAAGAGGALLVQQLAADGTLLGSSAQTLVPTSAFAPATLHLTALAGAAQARVVLLGGLTGKTTFDDVGLFGA